MKSSLQLQSLASRRLWNKLRICHRILNGASIIPCSFFSNAPRRCASHKNSMPLYCPYIRTLHHRHSFKWSVIDHWNKVPDNIASLKSTSTFSRLIALPPYLTKLYCLFSVYVSLTCMCSFLLEGLCNSPSWLVGPVQYTLHQIIKKKKLLLEKEN